MIDRSAQTGLGPRRFLSLRRRIYELLPDVPEEAIPLVLAFIEQAAADKDVTVLLAQLQGRALGG